MQAEYRGVISFVLVIVLGVSFLGSAAADSGGQRKGDVQSNEVYTGEEAELSRLRVKMAEYGFSDNAIEEVGNLVEIMQSRGLSSDPLLHKVYEGMAKNVDSPGIMRAADLVVDRYAHAFEYGRELAETPPQAAHFGNTLAQAFAAGWDDQDCRRLMARLQERIRNTDTGETEALVEQTLKAARDMARRRVSSPTISDVLVSALDQHYRARDMNIFRQRFAAMTNYAVSERIARQFRAGIDSGVGANQLGNDSERREEGGLGATGGERNGGDPAGGSGRRESGGSGGTGGGNGNSSGSSTGGSAKSSGGKSDNGSGGTNQGSENGGGNGNNGASGSGKGTGNGRR